MRNINNLLKFLLEQTVPTDKYVVWVDLDGVLADFANGLNVARPAHVNQLKTELSHLTREAFGNQLTLAELKPLMAGKQPTKQLQAIKRLFNDIIDQEYNIAEQEGFFANLEELPDAQELVKWVRERVSTETMVLTAPVSSPFCEPEKRKWAASHFGFPDSNIIVDQEKFKYAASNHILIDDRNKNIVPWKAAGGIGILHTSANDTIKQLKIIFQSNETK